MRAVAGSVLLLLLIPAVSAVEWGNVYAASDSPVQQQTPAVGGDYVAWHDGRRGPVDVMVRFTDGGVFALTRIEAAEGTAYVSADHDFVAWSHFALGAQRPGETAPRADWDLVIYDIGRTAPVFDSDTEGVNETHISLRSGRVAYVSDDGQRHVELGSLSGPSSYIFSPIPMEGDIQVEPHLGEKHLAWRERIGDQWHIRSLDLATQAVTTWVSSTPGFGVTDPVTSGDMVGWIEHSGGSSTVRVKDASGDVLAWTPPEGTAGRLDLYDGVVAIDVNVNQARQLWLSCLPEPPVRMPGHPAFAAQPDLGKAGVGFLSLQGGNWYAYGRPAACELDQTGADRGAPLAPWLVIVALAYAARKSVFVAV